MSLAEHQAKVATVCLGPSPSPEELRAVGDPERWAIYRTMVRARMHRVSEQALKRTREALGKEAFAALVDRWLAEAPPTTRFFRELPSQLAQWALEHGSSELEAVAHARDMLRYEIAVWEVKAEQDDRGAVAEFGFEGVPVFCRASRLSSVSHGVDRRSDDGSVEPFEGALLVYRGEGFRAKCLRLNPLAAALVRELRAAGEAGRSVTEAVQRAAADQGVAIDPKLIEGLSTLLEKLLSRGVIRGCSHSASGSTEGETP